MHYFILVLSMILSITAFSYAVDINHALKGQSNVGVDEYATEIKEIQHKSSQSAYKYYEEAFQLQKDSISTGAKHYKEVAAALGIDLPKNESEEEGNAFNTASLEKYVFISLSIPEKGLIEIIKQAKALGFIPVLRGFKDGSYMKTQAALAQIIQETDYGVIIDPELFKEFEIKVVPSIVITRAEEQSCAQGMSCMPRKYNKLSGNVTLDYAFKTLIKKGEAL